MALIPFEVSELAGIQVRAELSSKVALTDDWRRAYLALSIAADILRQKLIEAQR